MPVETQGWLDPCVTVQPWVDEWGFGRLAGPAPYMRLPVFLGDYAVPLSSNYYFPENPGTPAHIAGLPPPRSVATASTYRDEGGETNSLGLGRGIIG